jgi:type VI secretion system secreted protein Hcp
MGINGFLKVPDVPGPSARQGHENEIEVHGVTFVMEAPRDANSLARSGRVKLDPIVFTKYYDMSSPHLKQALADNRRFDEVVFSTQRSTDREGRDDLVVTLTEAVVTRYAVQPSADGSGLLEDQVSFAYASIGFSFEGGHAVTLTVSGGK